MENYIFFQNSVQLETFLSNVLIARQVNSIQHTIEFFFRIIMINYDNYYDNNNYYYHNMLGFPKLNDITLNII